MSQIIIDPFQEIISQHLSDINFLMRLLLRPQLQILCRLRRVGVLEWSSLCYDAIIFLMSNNLLRYLIQSAQV